MPLQRRGTEHRACAQSTRGPRWKEAMRPVAAQREGPTSQRLKKQLRGCGSYSVRRSRQGNKAGEMWMGERREDPLWPGADRREGAGLSWENTRLGGGDVKAVGGELRAACGCGVLVVQGHWLRAHPQSLPAVLPPRSLSIWQVVWNLPEGLYRAEGCFSSTSGLGRPCSRCTLQLFPGKWRKR